MAVDEQEGGVYLFGWVLLHVLGVCSSSEEACVYPRLVVWRLPADHEVSGEGAERGAGAGAG